MEARIITNRQQWNEFVAGAEQQCNVTQSYEWGQLLTTQDGEVLYVGVVDDGGKLCAAMLILVSHVSVSKSVYFYAPRGPIIDDPDSPAMTVLLNYVKALAHKYHAFMLKIEPGVPDGDAKWLSALHRRGFVANPEALHLRHEWVLDIRPDEEKLLAGMKKTWRYCVRLASRKDVTVRRGETLADIDTFYRILQTTSQRDTFMIYDKSFYEKLVELYGQSQNVALFIAEYEGQALGASLLVKMGRWCWYMYGASSNEHRDRMPNHLLQWTAIRWAKEQDCWYYNFRGIPDVLEESQPMWGVYLFKSGFGGYAMRSLETHDLPYNPLLYRLYRSWLDGRGWLKDVRARRHNKQLEAEKTEKQEKQNEQEETAPKAVTTQANTETKQARRERPEQAEGQPNQFKQPKQPKQPRDQKPAQPSQTAPQSTTPSDTFKPASEEAPAAQDAPLLASPGIDTSASQDANVATQDVPLFASPSINASATQDANVSTPAAQDAPDPIFHNTNVPTPAPLKASTDPNAVDIDVLHTDSNPGDADILHTDLNAKDANILYTDLNAGDAEVSHTDFNPGNADVSHTTGDANISYTDSNAGDVDISHTDSNLGDADAWRTDSNLGDADILHTNPNAGDADAWRTDIYLRGADLSRTDPIYGEATTNHAIPAETKSGTNETTEEILQRIIGSTERKTASSDEASIKATQEEDQTPVSSTSPTFTQTSSPEESMYSETSTQPVVGQRNEVQPAQASIEDPAEYRETNDEPEPVEFQMQDDVEDPKEHRETRDENMSTEPEARPEAGNQVNEAPEEQDPLNEETQKLPRIQMVQKYAGIRRPTEQDDAYKRNGMNGTGGHTK